MVGISRQPPCAPPLALRALRLQLRDHHSLRGGVRRASARALAHSTTGAAAKADPLRRRDQLLQQWTPSRRLGVLRLEVQRDAVDAIAQAGRRRAVRENMTEVAAASAAVHLGAGHSKAAVLGRFGRTGLRIIEARPAGAALEFAL